MGKYHIPHPMPLKTDKQSKEYALEKPIKLHGPVCPKTLLCASAMPSKIKQESPQTLGEMHPVSFYHLIH